MSTIIHTFNNIQQFKDRISDPQHHYNAGGGMGYGATSVAHAFEISAQGWAEQMPKATEVVGQVMQSVGDRIDLTPKVMMDVQGSVVDMGSYMTGEPECMVSFPLEDECRNDKVLKVLLDPGASGGYSEEYLATRAAAVSALLDVLQMLGHALEIWVASPVKEGRIQIHATVTKINEAGRYVSLQDIMYWCGHPSLLRRMVFTHRHMDGIGSGMGATMRMPQAVKDIVSPDVVVERGENLPYGTPDPGYDPEGWVMHTLQALGLAA